MFDEENLKIFWEYIKERFQIFKKRESGSAPPWTEDKILAQWKFTNVFRQDDPGTKFVIDKIIPSFDSDFGNLLFNIIAYRTFNKINTMEYIGFLDYKTYDPEYTHCKLLELIDDKKNVFTSAHKVSAFESFKKYDYLRKHGGLKVIRVANALKLYASKIPEIVNSLEKTNKLFKSPHINSEEIFYSLTKLPEIGPFLAYQICVDIGYFNTTYFDEDKFVVCGSGAKLGLQFLTNKKKMKAKDNYFLVLDLVELQFKENLELDKPLNLMAIENCLCEYSKYMKIKTRKGHARVKRPREEFEAYKIKYNNKNSRIKY